MHARDGEGQQPLHQAKTVAIAQLLLDHGAGIDAGCIDHKSTPAQYALVDRPDVCRGLLARGARQTSFMAARFGDRDLASRLLDADPACVSARLNEPGYAPVPPFHIYCWSLGFGRSPHDVALAFAHRDTYDLLAARSPQRLRFVNAVLAGDEPGRTCDPRADPVAPRVVDPQRTRAPGHGHSSRTVRGGRADAATRVRPRRARRRRRHGAARRVLGRPRPPGRADPLWAPSRSTHGIRRTRALRSAGPRSAPCTVARRAETTRLLSIGSSRGVPTSGRQAMGQA